MWLSLFIFLFPSPHTFPTLSPCYAFCFSLLSLPDCGYPATHKQCVSASLQPIYYLLPFSWSFSQSGSTNSAPQVKFLVWASPHPVLSLFILIATVGTVELYITASWNLKQRLNVYQITLWQIAKFKFILLDFFHKLFSTKIEYQTFFLRNINIWRINSSKMIKEHIGCYGLAATCPDEIGQILRIFILVHLNI